MYYVCFKTNNLLLILWYLYVFFPIVDYLMPLDNSNPSYEERKALEKDKRFLIPLYMDFVVDLALYVWMLYQVSIGVYGQTLANFIVCSLALSQESGLNAVVGHELFHKKFIVHKVVGIIPYAKVYYSHFYIAHTKFHHKYVATERDPTTAKLNESLYRYFVRNIYGCYQETWNQEMKRAGVSLSNKAIQCQILHLVLMLTIYKIFGLRSLAFSILTACFFVFLLETVNYIEHYGL